MWIYYRVLFKFSFFPVRDTEFPLSQLSQRLMLLTSNQDSPISKLNPANECRYLEFRRVFLQGFQALFTIHNSLYVLQFSGTNLLELSLKEYKQVQ